MGLRSIACSGDSVFGRRTVNAKTHCWGHYFNNLDFAEIFMIWREMFRYILREADLDTVECFDIFFCCMWYIIYDYVSWYGGPRPVIRLSTPCKLLLPGSTSSSVTRRLLQKDRTQATSHRRSYLWLAVGKTEPNAAMKSGDQFHLTPPKWASNIIWGSSGRGL